MTHFCQISTSLSIINGFLFQDHFDILIDNRLSKQLEDVWSQEKTDAFSFLDRYIEFNDPKNCPERNNLFNEQKFCCLFLNVWRQSNHTHTHTVFAENFDIQTKRIMRKKPVEKERQKKKKKKKRELSKKNHPDKCRKGKRKRNEMKRKRTEYLSCLENIDLKMMMMMMMKTLYLC